MARKISHRSPKWVDRKNSFPIDGKNNKRNQYVGSIGNDTFPIDNGKKLISINDLSIYLYR